MNRQIRRASDQPETRSKKGGAKKPGRTTRQRGLGHKRAYRIIDFRRYDKDGVPATVAHIEYDPNRTARIALLQYEDGERRYIIAPTGLTQGVRVESGPNANIKPGNNLPLRNIPVATMIHCVELRPGGGGKLARVAGKSVQLVAKDDKRATLRLPSGEMRFVDLRCRATVGELGDPEPSNVRSRRVGSGRWEGKLAADGPEAGSEPTSRPTRHSDLDVTSQLRAVSAARFLLGLAEKRAIQRANSAGMTQTDIARSLGISQPTVHRLVRQLQATSDELGERSVREIIAEAVIGTTDRESMMAGTHAQESAARRIPSGLVGRWVCSRRVGRSGRRLGDRLADR